MQGHVCTLQHAHRFARSVTAHCPACTEQLVLLLLLLAAAVLGLHMCAGVPIIADSKFMAAYSMIEPNAVYIQEDGKNELDVMFSVARMTPEEMWRIRLGEPSAASLCV